MFHTEATATRLFLALIYHIAHTLHEWMFFNTPVAREIAGHRQTATPEVRREGVAEYHY